MATLAKDKISGTRGVRADWRQSGYQHLGQRPSRAWGNPDTQSGPSFRCPRIHSKLVVAAKCPSHPGTR